MLYFLYTLCTQDGDEHLVLGIYISDSDGHMYIYLVKNCSIQPMLCFALKWTKICAPTSHPVYNFFFWFYRTIYDIFIARSLFLLFIPKKTTTQVDLKCQLNMVLVVFLDFGWLVLKLTNAHYVLEYVLWLIIDGWNMSRFECSPFIIL